MEPPYLYYIPNHESKHYNYKPQNTHTTTLSGAASRRRARSATAMSGAASDRLSIDGSPLSKLATRVSVLKRTGDDAFDLQASIDRDQKVRVIDMMEKNAGSIAKIHGFMSSKQFATMGSERAGGQASTTRWRAFRASGWPNTSSGGLRISRWRRS